MARLEGRIALVTGGGRGIGQAIAEAFAEEGAQIILADILEKDGPAAARKINQRHGEGRARFVRLDVTDEENWRELCARCEQDFGGLDILANNAGIYHTAPVSETTLEDWRRVMAVNVDGVFLGCKHALPLLKKRAGKWRGGGAIINLSSMAGIDGAAMHSAYCSSKGAVRLMTKAVALEAAAEDPPVRVNSLHPGVVETAMGGEVVQTMIHAGRANDTQSAAGVVAMLHPLRRMGQAGEIARAAVYLAGDDAAFITGAELVIDGGVTAG